MNGRIVVRRAARASACAALAASAVPMLAACAGSTSSHGVARPPVQTARETPRAGALPAGAGRDVVRAIGGRPVRARAQPGALDDEVSSSGARPLNPCALVSRAEARAIVGGPVGRPAQAPQGPTCLYSRRGTNGLITLAVESMPFSRVKPQARLRDRMAIEVRGRPAYCGVSGTPTLIVPLAGGRALTVGAPCPIAASFAARALSRLG